MYEKIEISRLNDKVVWITRQQYVIVNGVEYAVGDINRKSYDNSVFGRRQVEEELPNDIQNAIFAIWGDEPTVFPEDE